MQGSANVGGGVGRRWWLMAMVALALVLRAAPADACDCPKPPSLDEAFGYADVIVQVTVLSLDLRSNAREELAARVRVERSWKGARAGEELQVAPRQHEGGCVYWFPDLRPQLLYLKRTAAGLEVARGECGRSRELSRAAEEMAALDVKAGVRPAGSAGATASGPAAPGSAGTPPSASAAASAASPASPASPAEPAALPVAPSSASAGATPPAGPGQGGCAACALGDGGGQTPAPAAALLMLVVVAALMRRRRRAVLAVGAAVAALLARGGLAHACDCVPMPVIEEAFETADIVAEVAVTLPPGAQEADRGPRRIRLRVVRAWKGARPGDQLVIDRQTDSSCSYAFENEQPQLLYLARATGGVTVAGEECGRSQPMASAAEEVAALGKLATPLGAKRPLASPSAAASAPNPDPSVPPAPAAPSAGPPAAGASGCGGCAVGRNDGAPMTPWWALGGALLGAALIRRARRSAAGDDAR